MCRSQPFAIVREQNDLDISWSSVEIAENQIGSEE